MGDCQRHFLSVKLKTYLRNNIYRRLIQNLLLGATNNLARFSLAELWFPIGLIILLVDPQSSNLQIIENLFEYCMQRTKESKQSNMDNCC
jgi:hypothetical protein